MLKHLDIKARLLLLTLLPSSLLAVALSSYFIWTQLHNLENQLQQRGQLLAEQLAALAAPAIRSKQQPLLARITQDALEQADVRSVRILSPDNAVLASAGPQMFEPASATNGLHLTQQSAFDTTQLRLPVHERHRRFSDTEAADSAQLIGWIELELSHQGSLLEGYRSLLSSLILSLCGLLLSTLLALRLKDIITGPLRQIRLGVAQLREGHLETRLTPLGGPELDELADGINRMAEALQNAQEEMQHSIEQATDDVRQNLETIEIQNIELDLARKEALEASRVKSEFLANMSHEIRTPLNGILGFTRLLQKTSLSPRQQDFLLTIEKSAENLLVIINEVLDFSRIEAGKLVLENLPFNLRDLVQDSLTMLAPAAHSKQLELVCLIYRDVPHSLVGDPQRLKQILTNLLSNAIKFTHQGDIVVRAMLEDENDERVQLRISVQDSGIGLGTEDLRGLFQAFNQADNSLSRQAGGTGLGLTISKRLIEQMGGEIGVDSVPGDGSEFWISLSLAKAQDDDERPPSMLLGRRIALLEPHELARQSLQHQLQDCGLDVHCFNDLASLQAAVSQLQGSQRPIRLAMFGVSQRSLPAEQLAAPIEALDRLDCRSLVLCPTTEQALFSEALANSQSQLLAKPICSRTLQRALCELVSPRLVSPEQQETIAQPAAEQSAEPKPRVLCVDDNPANLLLVQTLLQDMGAEVCAVNSGYAALEQAAQEPFTLIFMDVQMPGMDGRQTTQAIRAMETERNATPVPIIALTAHAMPNEKRSLLQDGMDDYLTKPINERQLFQIMLKWTGFSLRQPAGIDGNEEPRGPGPLAALAVLDPDEAISLAAGKVELADEMLDMLLSSLDAEREALRQARAANAREELMERVHRLHGASRYCGVPQLRATCQLCEMLLKDDSPAAAQGLDELDSAIERLLQEAQGKTANSR